jgi:uncharacterized LabA/DUF88 family protein
MKKRLPMARVYIDGANMFYAQRDLGWIFDWKNVINNQDNLPGSRPGFLMA